MARGKSTGNHRFSDEIWGAFLKFSHQSIELMVRSKRLARTSTQRVEIFQFPPAAEPQHSLLLLLVLLPEPCHGLPGVGTPFLELHRTPRTPRTSGGHQGSSGAERQSHNRSVLHFGCQALQYDLNVFQDSLSAEWGTVVFGQILRPPPQFWSSLRGLLRIFCPHKTASKVAPRNPVGP